MFATLVVVCSPRRFVLIQKERGMRFHQYNQLDRIRHSVDSEGLALIEGLTPQTILSLSRAFGPLLVQDDTDQDGLKTVEFEAAMAGSAIHTDRSNMVAPPPLVLIGCFEQATNGGETLFCDGKALAQRLQQNNLEAWRALSMPQSACFGRPGYQHNSAIFSVESSVVMRFRTDPWGFYNAQVWKHLPTLLDLIHAHTTSVRLEAGQGYLVNNLRWLHGARLGQGGRRHIVRTMIMCPQTTGFTLDTLS